MKKIKNYYLSFNGEPLTDENYKEPWYPNINKWNSLGLKPEVQDFLLRIFPRFYINPEDYIGLDINRARAIFSIQDLDVKKDISIIDLLICIVDDYGFLQAYALTYTIVSIFLKTEVVVKLSDKAIKVITKLATNRVVSQNEIIEILDEAKDSLKNDL